MGRAENKILVHTNPMEISPKALINLLKYINVLEDIVAYYRLEEDVTASKPGVKNN